MRRAGASLLELVVYMALLAVVATLVARIVVANRRGLERPAASFQAQQAVLAVRGILQRDLEETHTSTVRFYPGPGHPAERPGLSLASPRLGRAAGERLVVDKGLPVWQKFVYYTLEPDARVPGTGQLVRFEGPLGEKPSTAPRASRLAPSQAPATAGSRRVVARGLALPGQAVAELNRTLDGGGGFRGRFQDARGRESLEDFQRHPLVAVDVSARQVSAATGRVTFLEYPIVVLPRN